MKPISLALLLLIPQISFSADENTNEFFVKAKDKFQFEDSRLFESSDRTQSLVGTNFQGFKILSTSGTYKKNEVVNYSECNNDFSSLHRKEIQTSIDFNCLHITNELCQFLIPTNGNAPLDNIDQNLEKMESCKNISKNISAELNRFFESSESKKYLEKVKNNEELISKYAKSSNLYIKDSDSIKGRIKNALVRSGHFLNNSLSNYNNVISPSKFKDSSNSISEAVNTLSTLKKAKDLCYDYGFRNRENILAIREIESAGKPKPSGEFKFQNK